MDTALHYAVCVGIDRYPALRDLRQAAGDATAFHAWVTDALGGAVPKANAKLVVVEKGQLPEPLTREAALPVQAQVFAELNRFRRQVDAIIEEDPDAWARTRLYFYVSGHGIAPEANDAALLMADAGPYDYGENVSCRALRDFFAKAQTFHEVLVFADCCREVAEAPLGAPHWTPIRRTLGNVNQAFCCATYFGDYAFEPEPDVNASPDEQRGYFTRALLEGLRGEAASSAGVIDTTTLAGYVQKRVRDLTGTRPRPQEAYLMSEPARPVLLREGSAGGRHLVELRFGAQPVGVVELFNAKLESLGTHDSGAGTWQLQLANDFYRVRALDPAARALQQAGFFEVRGEATHVDL